MRWYHSAIIFAIQDFTRVYLAKNCLPTWHYKRVLLYTKWSLLGRNTFPSPFIHAQIIYTLKSSGFWWDGIILPSFLKTTILHKFTYQKLVSQLDITNECCIILIHVFDTVIWPKYLLEPWYSHDIPWVIYDEVYFKLPVNIHGTEIITLSKIWQCR